MPILLMLLTALLVFISLVVFLMGLVNLVVTLHISARGIGFDSVWEYLKNMMYTAFFLLSGGAGLWYFLPVLLQIT